MSEPFLAEVRMMGFNFPPRGWATCDGQVLPIDQNQALYSLLGTTYGGDGRASFGLPDLRGRTPIHVGEGHPQGQKSGEETHTLAGNELPAHTHGAQGSSDDATAGDAAGNVTATAETAIYGTYAGANATAMGALKIGNAGGSQSHNNMQPFQTVNFCIALRGVFPSRN